MKLLASASTAAVLAGLLAAPGAFAQTVFTGTDIAEDRNEDLIEAIEDDAERDLDRFGNQGRPQGFSGSFALRGTLSDGNTDNLDIGAGANLNYVTGPNGFELDLSYAYGEEDGTQTEESLYYGLQYTRDFNPRFYGFAKVQGSVDQFSSFQSDVFASVGVGYQVIGTQQTQWTLQGGPGYRFADLSDVASADVSEAAIGLSSDYAQRLSSSSLLTNDTDVIFSDYDTVVYNDLAVSVSMTDTLSLRTSLLTEYHSNPEPGFENTDNTLGVALVYAFN